jgi:hypothetical protein
MTENIKPRFDFGNAISALKEGKKVQRAGWNGKGMYLFLQNGKTDFSKPVDEAINGVRHELFEAYESEDLPTIMPSVVMKTADGSHVIGWLASQTDMLAIDWQYAD